MIKSTFTRYSFAQIAIFYKFSILGAFLPFNFLVTLAVSVWYDRIVICILEKYLRNIAHTRTRLAAYQHLLMFNEICQDNCTHSNIRIFQILLSVQILELHVSIYSMLYQRSVLGQKINISRIAGVHTLISSKITYQIFNKASE